MDPANDCIVKLDTPIRSQEKNSLVIFELSEEDGHQAIVSIVVRCTLLHERICLVQEKHCFEVVGDLEYSFKLLLECIRISVVDNKFACGYLKKNISDAKIRPAGGTDRIEGKLEILRGCLNREGLPDARWATNTS